MDLIKMTVTDSMGRTYTLPELKEGEKFDANAVKDLCGTCSYVYKVVPPKAVEPSEGEDEDGEPPKETKPEEPQYVRDPYRFWASEAANTGVKAHEVALILPEGGSYSGLYRYPKIGEQTLVAVQSSGGSVLYYLMGYVPSSSVPFNVTLKDGAEVNRRIFEEKGEVLRYASQGCGPADYSEIGFYQEEKAQWPITAGDEDFPALDVLVLDSAGNIRETAWNHHLQKAARIEIFAGAPEVLDRKTSAVDEHGTLPLGDFPGDDSSLHRGDAHIRAANRVIIKADQEIRIQVGRTVLRIDDTGFNVITKNVAGNYINSYDTSIDMNPRNGISLTGKNINVKAGYRFNAGDGMGGTVATTMGNLNLGGREISIDSYNNTEFMFTVLYQALEYMVNAASGAMGLAKADIKIADYVNFAQNNLESLIKLARKANQLWAKRKEIVKQKDEAAREAAEAAAAAEAEAEREKAEEKEKALAALRKEAEEAEEEERKLQVESDRLAAQEAELQAQEAERKAAAEAEEKALDELLHPERILDQAEEAAESTGDVDEKNDIMEKALAAYYAALDKKDAYEAEVAAEAAAAATRKAEEEALDELLHPERILDRAEEAAESSWDVDEKNDIMEKALAEYYAALDKKDAYEAEAAAAGTPLPKPQPEAEAEQEQGADDYETVQNQLREAQNKLKDAKELTKSLNALVTLMEEDGPEDLIAFYQAQIALSRASLANYDAQGTDNEADAASAYAAALAELEAAYRRMLDNDLTDPARGALVTQYNEDHDVEFEQGLGDDYDLVAKGEAESLALLQELEDTYKIEDQLSAERDDLSAQITETEGAQLRLSATNARSQLGAAEYLADKAEADADAAEAAGDADAAEKRAAATARRAEADAAAENYRNIVEQLERDHPNYMDTTEEEDALYASQKIIQDRLALLGAYQGYLDSRSKQVVEDAPEDILAFSEALIEYGRFSTLPLPPVGSPEMASMRTEALAALTAVYAAYNNIDMTNQPSWGGWAEMALTNLTLFRDAGSNLGFGSLYGEDAPQGGGGFGS